MAKFTRLEVVQAMKNTGMVPLFYHEDIEVAKAVVKACYEGGARLLEFTSRGDFAHEVFEGLSKFCDSQLPEMILGVGSITDAASASQYMSMGANFIVTPVFRKDIAVVCNRRKVMWSPGCGTLTEICQAEEMGCEVVKLFPGATYGPSFVKAIKGPQPWTSIMPTGGVSPERDNLKAWFDAGVLCVGMGSQLLSIDLIKSKDYATITKRCKKALDLIKALYA